MSNSIESMDRAEVIFALASYAHPTWYHSLLRLPTGMLKALLVYYQQKEN